MDNPNGARGLSGFSIVELLAAITMMTALSLSLISVLTTSGDAVAEASANTQVDTELLKAIDRLHTELSFVTLDQVDLVDPQTLSFSVVEGWNGNAPLYGPVRTLTLTSNNLALDGDVFVENVSAAVMAINGNRLVIDLTVQYPYTRNGVTEMVDRNTLILHRFED